MKISESIILRGSPSFWRRMPELILAREVIWGVAQIVGAPMSTEWVAAQDIVRYNTRRSIMQVLIRNARTHYGKFDVAGMNERSVSRNSERVGRFLKCHLIDCSFSPFFPGVFSMSVDVRIPLERLWELGALSPVPFHTIRREEWFRVIRTL